MRDFLRPVSDYLAGLGTKKIVLALLIIITAAYVNSLSANFIWDDYYTVLLNENIRSVGFQNILNPLYQENSPAKFTVPAYYRPLQTLSNALDFSVWKLNPFGYHLTNLALHGANAILLYFLLRFLLNNSLFAFLGAAVFGAHPVFVSSVGYISGRADILLLFFTLLTLLCFIKSIRSGTVNVLFYCLSLFCFLGVLLSKEIGVISLVFLLAADKAVIRYSVTKAKHFIYVPFILIVVLWLAMKSSAVPGFHASAAGIREIALGCATIVKGNCVYTFLSVIPLKLHMGRSITAVSSFRDPWFVIALAVLVITAVACKKMLGRNRPGILGLTWFYLPLSIMTFFNFFFAKRGNEVLLPEHNLYFCYAGLLILLFSTLSSLRPQEIVRKYAIAVVAVCTVFYAQATIALNSLWQDEIRFFSYTIECNTGSAFNFTNYANLGFAYERAKKPGLAERNFISAAENSGGNPAFYNMLAAFYRRNGDSQKNLETLIVSRELDRNFYHTYFLLGVAYLTRGQQHEARRNFETALALNPSHEASRKYAEALRGQGE